jgi:hypothetical protein
MVLRVGLNSHARSKVQNAPSSALTLSSRLSFLYLPIPFSIVPFFSGRKPLEGRTFRLGFSLWKAVEVVRCERKGPGYLAGNIEGHECVREIVGDFEPDALAKTKKYLGLLAQIPKISEEAGPFRTAHTTLLESLTKASKETSSATSNHTWKREWIQAQSKHDKAQDAISAT